MKLSKGKMIETTVIKENDKLAIGSIYYTSDMDDNFSSRVGIELMKY